MTLTNVTGLPGEIRAALGRARVSQDAACETADLSRQTYYRRMGTPGDFRLDELERLLAAAGYVLQLDITAADPPMRDDADTWTGAP